MVDLAVELVTVSRAIDRIVKVNLNTRTPSKTVSDDGRRERRVVCEVWLSSLLRRE